MPSIWIGPLWLCITRTSSLSFYVLRRTYGHGRWGVAVEAGLVAFGVGWWPAKA